MLHTHTHSQDVIFIAFPGQKG